MLRTIVVQNLVLKNCIKKAIRSNITRRISTQLLQKKHSARLSKNASQRIISIPQWSLVRHYASLPPHQKINLPALSPTMESGTIVRWEKKEGDKISEGDLLCEIETDKATMGFEAPEEGYLAKILIPEGTKGVPVGKLLCITVENQADVAAFKDFKDDSPAPAPKAKTEAAAAAPAPKAAPAPAPKAAPAPAARPAAPAAPAPPAAPAGGRVYASPLARRIAELRNIRLGGEGSGLHGSLKSLDLAGAPAGGPSAPAPASAAAPAPGASYVDLPVSGMRETIARRLTEAKLTAPHFQVSIRVNVEKTLQMRSKVNKTLERSGQKISVNDFIIKAAASACKRVPAANAHWMDTYIRQYSNVDVSVAVSTPSGLITPIVFNADSRGLLDISKNMKELATKARDGKLQPQEYQGGTITVSNLGMFGITSLNAIINPPQSLILGCGGAEDFVIADKEDPAGFRVAKFITFTISGDHRVLDGAVAAEWMAALKQNLEDPANIIL